MSPLRLFFHWPDGGVWSNLVASLIWAVPGFLSIHIHIHRKHKKLIKHLSISGKIDT